MPSTRVARASELSNGEKRCLVVDGHLVLLVKIDGQVHAYENRCAHRGLPLGSGRLEGHVLTCPVHEWQYDVRTGRSVMPDGAMLRRFTTTIVDDDVMVDLPSESPR